MNPKTCKECGKSFIPRSGTQLYCSGPHIAICEYCGREFEYTCSPKDKPKYCCKGCITEGKKQTVRTKYGVDNVSELQSVKDKISKVNSSDEVKAKRKETSLSRWGVDNPAKHPEVRKRMSEIMKSDSYLSRRSATCREKYGFDSPTQSQSVKDKRNATCIEKYGCSGHINGRSFYAKRMTDGDKVAEYLAFKEDPVSYIVAHYPDLPTIRELRRDLGVTETPIYDILISKDCEYLLRTTSSNMEDEVVEFLMSICPTIQIQLHNRTIIAPNEIDIYLPEYKLGIECNPTATHNSSFSDPWGGPPKDYKYHQRKSLQSIDSGIFLFHIFGYEWVNHREIIESMLCNLIHCNLYSVGARKAYVDNITGKTCQEFLESNHRQGSTFAKVRLALRSNDTNEILSVMTFNHMRNTLGRTHDDDGNTWELSRFCNKLCTTVSGSASKLFQYFVKHYNPSKIVSFSDVAHTRGTLYEVLGFHQEHITTPSYVWCHDSGKYLHRVSCQKRNLPVLLNESIDISKYTEKEIMESHGFSRVYDSGVIRWVWSRY